MTSSDRIEQRIFLAASPERVWRALTDANEFSRWFGSDLDDRIAAGVQLNMTCQGERFVVDIIELTPPTRLVWRWHPGWIDPAVDYTKEPRTTTVFDVAAHGDGTMLTVTELGFEAINAARRASVFKDNVNGWLEQVLSLKTYIENAV